MLNDNRVFANLNICKKFIQETGTIENLTDELEVKDDLSADFCIYIQTKMRCEDKENSFVCILYLENDEKLKCLDQFNVPHDDDLGSANIFQYNRIYEMEKFIFPGVGRYDLKLFAIKKKEYEEFGAKINKENKVELFNYLSDNDYLINVIWFTVK